MPKRKKKWIDKKQSVTFRLVPKSQKETSTIDENVGEQMLQPIQKKDFEEHIKYGIYFNDDYNYLQHLKSLDEVSSYESVERTILKVPAGKANIPSTLYETNGYELSIGSLSQPSLSSLEVNIDPEVAAALEGNFDFDDPENSLEDDFVLSANDGELPSLHPPIPHPQRKNECRSMENIGCGESSGDESESSNFFKSSDEDLIISGTCNGDLRPIDEQFKKFFGKYDDTSGEETDEEEKQYLLDPNSDQIKLFAQEFKNRKAELILQKDEIARRYAELDEKAEEAGEELELITIDCAGKKKAKWDCESIISTYSNLYNRPALIVEASSKRKLKSVPRQIEKMDEVQSTISKFSLSTVRTRGETTEERRARKALVKAFRAERRAEKKCNKIAFKEERRKLTSQRSKSVIKTIPVV